MFDDFKRKHGAPSRCEPVTEEQLRAFRGKLPDDLLAEWEASGWCAYGNGLLWTVNPDAFADSLDDWLDDPAGAYVYLRTAFGSLFVWDGSNNYYIDVLYKDVTRLFNRISFVFDGTLCDNDYLRDVIDRPLFSKAVSKFGPLSKDECYGCLPPPALGGSFELDFLERVKLREYLSIAAHA